MPAPRLVQRHLTLAPLMTAAIALLATTPSFAATPDLEAIRQQVVEQHDVSIQRLKDWIALPSIAAEDLNSREGAEHMAKLARDAGFQQVEILETDGKPGVFATLDAGAAKGSGTHASPS